MKRETFAACIFILALAFIGVALDSARFEECRSRGFSAFYCATN